MSARNWEIREESTTACPGLHPEAIPSFAFEYVSATLAGGVTHLTVDGYVGLIPLIGGGHVRIRAKYGDNAYLYMLFAARNILDGARPWELDEAAFQVGEDVSPPELIARTFSNGLSTIQASGLLNARVTRQVEDSFSHGRINALKTALGLAKRLSLPIVSSREFKTTDTPEHRVLSRAALAALSHLNEETSPNPVTACRRWLRSFPSVADIQDIRDVELRLAQQRYGKSRGYYDGALASALVLLGVNGVSDAGNELSQDCVLVHTPTLFEEFVRIEIRRILSPAGYIVTKGAQPGNEFLYTSGMFELQPDLCVYRRGTLRIIGDAKYKTPDAKDHYQLLAYMRQYGVKSGFFVSPSKHEKDTTREYQTSDGLVVRDIKVDLKDLPGIATTLTQIPTLAA